MVTFAGNTFHSPSRQRRLLRRGADGFTLIELAMVMFIVAMLIGGMLMPLATQQDVRRQADGEKILAEAREALIGYAMVNDRLPCPATATSNGVESPVGGGVCTQPYDGFLPAVTLSIGPVDDQGYLLDGWGGEAVHRIRYAVSTANTSAITTGAGAGTNTIKAVTMTVLAPDLKVCNRGAAVQNAGQPTADCSAGAILVGDAMAIVYSVGKNAAGGGFNDNEKHNPNPFLPVLVAADRVFVSAPPNDDFDDNLVWLSKHMLFSRMVAAGRLP